MDEATKQEWFPEWFFTGAVYHDIGVLARTYPTEQSKQAFGISFLFPYLQPDDLTEQTRPISWYWGQDRATDAASAVTQLLLVPQRRARRGPQAHARRRSSRGSSRSPPPVAPPTDEPAGSITAYGRSAGLPYDEYASQGLDYAPWWWDPTTSGPGSAQWR